MKENNSFPQKMPKARNSQFSEEEILEADKHKERRESTDSGGIREIRLKIGYQPSVRWNNLKMDGSERWPACRKTGTPLQG